MDLSRVGEMVGEWGCLGFQPKNRPHFVLQNIKDSYFIARGVNGYDLLGTQKDR